jgi:SEC-C motif-containing protein
VDLEYLYYLPFCNAFSSGDAFHRRIAKYSLKSDQVFVDRDELKMDLQRLAKWWVETNDQERESENNRTGPPENEQSITHRLWQKLMTPGYRDSKRLERSLCPEAERKLMEHVRNLVATRTPNRGASSGSLDDCNFVVRKHSVRLDGPCICGSDKSFEDCCGRGLRTTSTAET